MSVRTNVADRIAEVLLDHPPVNAFDSAGWRKLAETITAVGNDPDGERGPPRRRRARLLRRRRHQGARARLASHHPGEQGLLRLLRGDPRLSGAGHRRGARLRARRRHRSRRLVRRHPRLRRRDLRPPRDRPRCARRGVASAAHVPDPEGPEDALHGRADHGGRGVSARRARGGRAARRAPRRGARPRRQDRGQEPARAQASPRSR